MTDSPSPAVAVGAKLRQLLDDEPRFRRRWQQASRRPVPRGTVSVAAVSRVVVEHLWEQGERPETTSDRSVRDRIRRALAGELCSEETLRWLLEAFDMRGADAAELIRLLRRDARPHAISGQLRLDMLPPPRHRIRSLNESHSVGPDRRPSRHRTTQVLEALVDDYRVYSYRFDTPHARVEVVEGGTAGAMYEVSDGLWAVDLTLPRALQAGETASLTYDTLFEYEEPPAPEVRRAALLRVDSVNIKVAFSREALPDAVWWAQWDLGAAPVEQREVDLDERYSAERFTPLLEHAIVGFHWRWPTG